MIFVLITACSKNRRPGLSDKELFAQRNVETLQESEEQAPDFSDMETYVIPPGIKYEESRAIDPANPPVVLDIANRNLNIRKFDLSDYYTKVRYIKINDPKLLAEVPRFIFTDDFIIAGSIRFGIRRYNMEGEFLNVIETNNDVVHFDGRLYIVNSRDIKGYDGNMITANGNYILYNVVEDEKTTLCLYDLTKEEKIMARPFVRYNNMILANGVMASYVYRPVSAPENFLFTFDLKGDTLCRFPNYNPVPVMTGGAYPSPPSPYIYYYDKQLTIRQTLNDTVYRLVVPNRLVPAYVLNFGTYRADAQSYFRENLSEKLLPNMWKETDKYILFTYNKDRDFPNNRTGGNVKFFYSYYDKKSRQFYHFSEGNSIPPDQFFMENPIPDALPFMLSYANIEEKQLRVWYSKKRLEEISNSKEFAAIPPKQQNKLKNLQDELDDNEFLIMILE